MSKTKTHKKIFLEDFPKHQSGEFKGCIDWHGLNNHIVRFEYKDISDSFLIKYFDETTEKILVEYKGKEIWCHRSTFKRNNVGRIVGSINGDFRYDIGDKYITNESDFTIIDKKMFGKKKMYKYRCNKCGFDASKPTYYKGELIDYWVTETNLKVGITCPCCGKKNTYTQCGINDITTTDPWMVPYFQGGYDEASKYLAGSEVKKKFICPRCHQLKNKKMYIYTLHQTKTISCPFRSDGFSYPEKFVGYFLKQLQEPFISQYSPEWANNRRYDFYLPNLNIIIEVDGGLGHGKKAYNNQDDLIGKQVDEYKDDLALENINCVVFRVNADISSLEYMKESLLQTFQNIFHMDFINWEECEKIARGSILIDVCNTFNDNVSIPDIAAMFYISEKTIKRYLDVGTKIGLCNDYRKLKKNKKTESE